MIHYNGDFSKTKMKDVKIFQFCVWIVSDCQRGTGEFEKNNKVGQLLISNQPLLKVI